MRGNYILEVEPQMSHAPAVESRGSAGAPETEIEVTPEMIEAGVEESCLYDREDPKSWEVEAVYRAMESCRRKVMATDHH